tara:strand:- start:101 stop:457 length:357 start_codon:yes stop_codon:yes gene_type:complete
MQFFMACHQRNIVAIKQPVNLLTGQGNNVFTTPRPAKLLFGQGFVIQHKTVIFPQQAFDFITPPIGEGIQATVKGIMPQFLLDDGGKAIALFAKVDRVTIEEYAWRVVRWPKIPRHQQ